MNSNLESWLFLLSLPFVIAIPFAVTTMAERSKLKKKLEAQQKAEQLAKIQAEAESNLKRSELELEMTLQSLLARTASPEEKTDFERLLIKEVRQIENLNDERL